MNRLMTILALLLACCSFSVAQTESLIANGNFDADAGWGLKEGASIEAEDGNKFLRLSVVKPGEMVMVYRSVPITDQKALELKYRVRYEGLTRGEKLWFDGRIMMNFKDAAGNVLKPAPGAPNYKGTSKGWSDQVKQYLVPDGAKQFEIMFTLFNAKAGTIDFDDILLTATDPAPVNAARDAAAQKKSEDQASRAATVKAKVPAVAADKLPLELKVEGNRIINSKGEHVWLQGVAVPSMTWSAGGEHLLESVEVACRDWKANCIRLGVREHFYAGTGPYQADGGAGYRQLIDDVVNLAASYGAYTVIDLHRFRAPEEKDAQFWSQVAEKYKNHPAVLFELFNEPHDISWEVWRDGGEVTDKKSGSGAAAENNEKLVVTKSVGMQRLVDVVRATGAKNIVIAGGLDWSYDISGVLKGFALKEPGGNGIVYSTHVYSWKKNWQEKFLAVAEKYPLFLGECGASQERMPFIPQAQHEDPSTWVPDFLGMVQANQLNWTGWSFHPKASPCLLSDWDYTPTPYWGALAKRALAGEKFETKKMR